MATGTKFLGVLQDQADIAGADEVEDSGTGILCMVGKLAKAKNDFLTYHSTMCEHSTYDTAQTLYH